MATETVNVRFTQTGAKQVTRSMVGLTAAMAGVGYGAIRMGKAIVEGADEMINLRNATKVFAANQADANYRMQETVRIARGMNQGLGSVADVVQRVSLAQKSAGFGTETTIAIVENLTKAVALSGATAQEAEGALRQFGQGLAANRFSGQELNSVLEQTPLVAQILADHLKVAVGDLRAMGEAGELTTKVLVDAFGHEIPGLAEKMSQFTFSVESQFVSIRREAVLFGDTLSQQTGALSTFQGFLNTMRDNLSSMNDALAKGGPEAEQLTKNIYGLATGAGVFIGMGLLAVVAAMVGPFTILAGAIAAAAGAYVAFGDESVTVQGRAVSAKGAIAALGNEFKLLGTFAVDAGKDMVSGILDKLGQITLGAQVMLRVLQDPFGDWTLGELLAQSKHDIQLMTKSGQDFWNIMSDQGDDGQGLLGAAIEGNFGRVLDNAEKFSKDLNTTLAGAGATAGSNVATPAPGSGVGAGASPLDATAISKMSDSYLQLKSAMDPVFALQHEMTEGANLLEQARQNGIITDQEAIATGQLLAENFREQMDELNFDKFQDAEAMRAGAAKGFSDFFEGLGSEATAWADGISGAFGMATDALTNFMTTGKMDFKAFAKDMINMIMKIIVKLLLMKALEGMAGGMAGSASGLISGIGNGMLGAIDGAKATGGPVASGKSYLVGEKGPELFVPPSSGSIKNATATAGMAPKNNITVVNVDDPSSIPSAMSTEAGEEVILNVITRNPDVLRELT